MVLSLVMTTIQRKKYVIFDESSVVVAGKCFQYIGWLCSFAIEMISIEVVHAWVEGVRVLEIVTRVLELLVWGSMVQVQNRIPFRIIRFLLVLMLLVEMEVHYKRH